MKNTLRLALAVLFCIVLCLGAGADAWAEGVAIDEINFPDEVFREYVAAYCDKDGNGVLSEAEIATRQSFSLYDRGIFSLQGIEYFTSLKSLYCDKNMLVSLDVSSNIALTYLDCGGNYLTSLDVSNNTALTSLDCGDNYLKSLDVNGNTALTSLSCGGNQLMSLNVSNNTALTSLSCYNNRLTSLNVSGNTALISLYCNYNQLTSLDVSNNTALTSLNCGGNRLTSLDVSGNTALTSLSCYSNQLTSLDVSNNTALTSLDCGGNQLTSLDISGNSALTSLGCGGNQLTSLDISGNTALTSLDCENNKLTSLDVRGNTDLTSLYCGINYLTSLDVSSNAALTSLDCAGNRITSLFINDCEKLRHLECCSNLLTSLDISNCPALVWLVENTQPFENGSRYGGSEYSWGSNDTMLYYDNRTVTLITDPSNVVSVSFDKNAPDAENQMEPQAVNRDEEAVLKACTFTRAGYFFSSWNTEPDGSGTSYADGDSITISEDITLYAQWTEGYTIRFDKNADDAWGTMNPLFVPKNSGITLPNRSFNRSGYSFQVWNTAPDGTGTAYNNRASLKPTEDMTLFAQWKKAFQIMFYSNASGSSAWGETVTEGNSITIPSISDTPPAGKEFDCWNTKPDGSGDSYYPDDVVTPTGDMDLYPKWVKGVTVLYDPGNGVGSAISTTVPVGIKTKLPKPADLDFTAQEGKLFAGWLIEGEDKLFQAGDEYAFDAGKRVTAQWAERIKVSYDLNGGSGSRKAQYLPKDTPSKLASMGIINYTRYGYTFVGWGLVPSAVTPKYADGDTVSFSSDITLFAIWEQTSFAGYVEIIGSESDYMNSAYCGETLTCTVTGESTYHVTKYQWLADGAVIPGATNASYTPTENDFGKAIACIVYTDAPENASRESNTKYVTIDAESEKVLIDNGITQGAYIFGVTSDMSYSIDSGERQAVMIDDMHRMPVSKKGNYSFYKGGKFVSIVEVVNWYSLSYSITNRVTTSSSSSSSSASSSSSSSSSSSRGSGTVRMYNGGTQLTATSKIVDKNGNVIIQGAGITSWLVREGANTDLKVVVTPSIGSYGHVSLNSGDYSSSVGERTIPVSPITEPMRFEIVFSREANYPPVPIAAIDEENFPDPVFRQFVSTNVDRDGDGLLYDSEISIIRNVSVSNMGIGSLKGIEYFTALQYLYCANNSLTSLDMLDCPMLTYLSCNGNALTSLDLSGCPALSTLYCSDNVLTELDLSVCPVLTDLQCSGNLLISINLSGNPQLRTLYCQDNLLGSLELDSNPALSSLYCQGNLLTELDLNGKTALTSLNCYGNLLSWLDVSGCARLRTLNCEGNELAALDLSGCEALSTLNCYGNMLSELDLNDCTSLRRLSCANNSLTSLNVSGYSLLTTLTCQSNHLEELHVKNCPALKALTCQRNALTELNLGGCDALLTLIQNVNPVVTDGVVSYGVNSSGSAILSFDEGVLTNTIPDPALTLPAALAAIGSEAFAGGAFDSVYIPDSVTSIAEDAFGDRTSLTIIGVPGSTAEVFAQAHGFDFVPAA